jgi:replicative DNA helicase
LQWFATEQPSLTINQVRVKARQLKRQKGLSVLVVDYIGLMNGSDPKMPRAYQLEEISRGLKSLAKELEIAVICLAQLNRKVDERGDKPPTLSDLRDSGAIEQDADVVMFLHRPVQVDPDLGGDWKHYAKLHVAKNRQGRSGVVVDLSYIGEQTRFANWSGPAPVVKVRNAPTKGMKDE